MLRNQRALRFDSAANVANELDRAEETAKLETLQVLREAIGQQREFLNYLNSCRPARVVQHQPNHIFASWNEPR